MALVFGLRLALTGFSLLVISLAFFALSLTKQREWETLFVLFAVFVLCVSYVLIFIRLEGWRTRLPLLTPFPMLFLPGAELVAGGLWFTSLLVLAALHRESGCRSFQFAQILLGAGGVAAAFVPSGQLMVGVFWAVVLVVPGLIAYACWEWQRSLKEKMALSDLDQT